MIYIYMIYMTYMAYMEGAKLSVCSYFIIFPCPIKMMCLKFCQAKRGKKFMIGRPTGKPTGKELPKGVPRAKAKMAMAAMAKERSQDPPATDSTVEKWKATEKERDAKARRDRKKQDCRAWDILRYLEISWDVSKFYDMFSIVFLQVRTDQLGDVRWYFSRRNNHWAQDGRPSDSTAMIRRRTQLGLVGMAPMAPMAVRWLHFPTGPTGCFTDFVNILEKHLFTIDSDDSAAFWSP